MSLIKCQEAMSAYAVVCSFCSGGGGGPGDSRGGGGGGGTFTAVDTSIVIPAALNTGDDGFITISIADDST